MFHENSAAEGMAGGSARSTSRRRSVRRGSSPSTLWKKTSRRLTSVSSVRSRRRSHASLATVDLGWYSGWLKTQWEAVPEDLKSLTFLEDRSLGTSEGITAIFADIERYLETDDIVSLDEVAESIFLDTPQKFNPDGHRQLARQRQAVFALLGWRTMLYQPTFNTCGPSDLAIREPENQPDSGLVFDTYRVPMDLCDRPLSVLLKSFGNLLPARASSSIRVASETAQRIARWAPLYPDEVNANTLQILGKVSFRWVDSLSLHLDYDRTTRTLSLFAFPSICAAALQRRGAIFAFASHERLPADPRADVDDIRDFLGEVLLSYRLLFGQNSKSRRLFLAISTPTDLPFEEPDTLLTILCTAKSLDLGVGDEVFPQDRPVYFAAKHFPVMNERIALLAKELDGQKPKSMRDLLRDRRDKLQWWTFWLISILGGLGLILSSIQVVLQGVQLSMEKSGKG